MHRMSVQILSSVILGVLIAYLGGSLFGYLVAYPFSSFALRSGWLVPLLRTVAWIPLVLFAAFSLNKVFPERAIFLGFLAALGGLVALVVLSEEYIGSMGWFRYFSRCG